MPLIFYFKDGTEVIVDELKFGENRAGESVDDEARLHGGVIHCDQVAEDYVGPDGKYLPPVDPPGLPSLPGLPGTTDTPTAAICPRPPHKDQSL